LVNRDSDTELLIEQAGRGDSRARQQLLERHRDRLSRMVAVRLDRRVAARLDPSDVVQDALLDAAQQLSEYLKKRPLPFYPWLRRFAWEHLVKMHQRHLAVRKRSAGREEQWLPTLPDESALQLARQLAASGTSPSNRFVRQEMRDRVQAALGQLSEDDREVLVLRCLEQLSIGEIAAVQGISEGAVKMRRTRALERLCRLLGIRPGEEDA
jgi:RNA polymerase sigma-70 factor (ECF subfamily)